MTREHKLALIIGFSLVLVVGVLISDHFSKARSAPLATEITAGSEKAFGAGTSGLRIVGVSSPAPGAASLGGPAGPGATIINPPPAPLPESTQVAQATPRESSTIIDMGLSRTHSALADTTVQPPSDSGVRPLDPVSGAPVTPAPVPGRTGGGQSTPPATQPEPAKAESLNGVPVKLLARHDVREGETLFRIAQEAYGDGRLWTKIVDFNKGKLGSNNSLRVGVTLLLPPKEYALGRPLPSAAEAIVPEAAPVKPTRQEAAVKPEPATRRQAEADARRARPEAGEEKKAEEKRTASAKTYTVQKGDSLSDIARKTLGSSKRWNEIVEMNRDVLSDEDSLEVGKTLKLPVR